MATMDERPRRGGGVSYRVRWYEWDEAQGKNVLRPATFENEDTALVFIDRLEKNGGRDPDVEAILPRQEQPAEPVPEAPADRTRITFDALFREYNENYARGSKKTKAYNLRDYENHVMPHLGHLPVVDIFGAQILKWQNDLLSNSAVPETVGTHAHA